MCLFTITTRANRHLLCWPFTPADTPYTHTVLVISHADYIVACLEDPKIPHSGNTILVFVLKRFCLIMCNPVLVQPFTFLMVIYLASIYMEASSILERSYCTKYCTYCTSLLAGVTSLNIFLLYRIHIKELKICYVQPFSFFIFVFHVMESYS